MIKEFKNMVNNVIDRLIVMGECCQTPRFLDNYLRAIPEVPIYKNNGLVIGNWEKEMAMSGVVSKATQLGEEPVLSGNAIGEKVLAAK